MKPFLKRGDEETPAKIETSGPENAALMLGAEDFEIDFTIGQHVELSLAQFVHIETRAFSCGLISGRNWGVHRHSVADVGRATTGREASISLLFGGRRPNPGIDFVGSRG